MLVVRDDIASARSVKSITPHMEGIQEELQHQKQSWNNYSIPNLTINLHVISYHQSSSHETWASPKLPTHMWLNPLAPPKNRYEIRKSNQSSINKREKRNKQSG